MSAILKNLAKEPNAAICLKAYLDAANYLIPQLMSEAQIRERIMRTMQGHGVKHSEMRAAIQKGFDAARLTPEQEPEQPCADPAEYAAPLPNNGLADAKFI